MSNTRRKIVAGNWKMNGSKAMASDLIARLREQQDYPCDVIICPPAAYLGFAAEKIQGSSLKLGAQTVSEHESGAYTGELAASMLAEFCDYVIVGHSERRSLFGETNEQVAQKFKAAQDKGLMPILCVGETLEQREAGATLSIVLEQIKAVIDACGIQAFENAIVAYEPVWAIGTGKTASPEQAQDVHKSIRDYMTEFSADVAAKLALLYGGSVKADNAQELFSQQDIDGGLIGGASLQAESFIAICNAAG